MIFNLADTFLEMQMQFHKLLTNVPENKYLNFICHVKCKVVEKIINNKKLFSIPCCATSNCCYEILKYIHWRNILEYRVYEKNGREEKYLFSSAC
jgi:hypothetical protein